MRLFIFLIVLIVAAGCGDSDTKSTEHYKEPFVIESLNSLNAYLQYEAYEIGYNDYHLKYMDSEDSIDVDKYRYSYKLYEINILVDSLSRFLTKEIINTIDIEQYRLDTISYQCVINNYATSFNIEKLKNDSITKTFDKIVIQQRKVRGIREEIIKDQYGKGKIICREVGLQFRGENLNNCKDFWETFYLIEKLTCTIYKEILCTYSNLHSYNRTLNYDYSIFYNGHYTGH